MILTRDNYYTPEADREFMSCSQYQGFLECEAKAMAKLSGKWRDKPTEALIVGNYFHTYLESPKAHEEFCAEHFDDIFKTKTTKKIGTVITGKKAPFVLADKMLAVAENDPLIKNFIDMSGESEAIMYGELFGVPWRIRIDKYVSEGRTIIDWKTTKSIWETSYNPMTKERESFIESYGYMMRAAVYTAIERQFTQQVTDAHFIIVAISKQDPPDKDVFLLDHKQRYELELEKIKENLTNIRRVRDGSVKPRRCGQCDYCRATKRLYSIKPYYKLAPEFREGREEENEFNAGEVLDEASAKRAVECMPPVPQAPQVGEDN